MRVSTPFSNICEMPFLLIPMILIPSKAKNKNRLFVDTIEVTMENVDSSAAVMKSGRMILLGIQ